MGRFEIDFNLYQHRFGCHAGLDPASRDLLHLSTGFRLAGRNDKSHSDNTKITSSECEGFQLSPKGTLKEVGMLKVRFFMNLPNGKP